ncbi:MAG: glutamate N-acetyltransferase/amino-acid N-acetyltransferase [Rhodothermales bacterium]|jgi:glutamate N-acetyltransferase/amino-acid N-acetyltransferase
MKFHTTPIMPQGFTCMSTNCGLKADGSADLALFVSEQPCNAAAVFTRNLCPGAPIIVGRELITSGRLRAVVVNSKISNVGTGDPGIADARQMGALAATELGVPAGEVLMSSTGVILTRLPMDKLASGIAGASAQLVSDPLVGARGIMTTDTVPKAISISIGDATLTVVGKGSGMISPNMATMLVYAFTDAEITSDTLDRALRDAVADSFNMLSIDTDTSTSDTVAVLANGLAGPVPLEDFRAALRAACIRMTEMLARDGEGASKLLRATAKSANSAADARFVARALVDSPLIKTMVFGGDPNIGRVLMAIGKCVNCDVDLDAIRIIVNGHELYRERTRQDYDDDLIRAELSSDTVDIVVHINTGSREATAYGCDLTHGYIDENAAYYSS